jgi:hypothetical protein
MSGAGFPRGRHAACVRRPHAGRGCPPIAAGVTSLFQRTPPGRVGPAASGRRPTGARLTRAAGGTPCALPPREDAPFCRTPPDTPPGGVRASCCAQWHAACAGRAGRARRPVTTAAGPDHSDSRQPLLPPRNTRTLPALLPAASACLRRKQFTPGVTLAANRRVVRCGGLRPVEWLRRGRHRLNNVIWPRCNRTGVWTLRCGGCWRTP